MISTFLFICIAFGNVDNLVCVLQIIKVACSTCSYVLHRFAGAKRGAARKMLTFIDMVNETTGDSISDLLIVETILHARGWSVETWENCYSDLPNRLLKVTVEVRCSDR